MTRDFLKEEKAKREKLYKEVNWNDHFPMVKKKVLYIVCNHFQEIQVTKTQTATLDDKNSKAGSLVNGHPTRQ